MRDAKQHQGLAKTVGLFRPVVLIEDGLRDALDDEALRAVELHECAHARHRDPLRLWLAQLVTDLQWPSPAAPRRLSAWLDELELARDDDAIASGADPAALAHAIVTCAKLQGAGADDLRPAATLTRGANLLRRRVRRLLDEPARPGPQGEGRTRSRLPIVLVSALVASAVLGAVYGESVVRTLTLSLG